MKKSFAFVSMFGACLLIAGCQPKGAESSSNKLPADLPPELVLTPTAPEWTGHSISLVEVPELTGPAQDALLRPSNLSTGLVGTGNQPERDKVRKTLTSFIETTRRPASTVDRVEDEFYAEQLQHLMAAECLLARFDTEEGNYGAAAERLREAISFTSTAILTAHGDTWQDVVPSRLIVLDAVKTFAATQRVPQSEIGKVFAAMVPIHYRKVYVNTTRQGFQSSQYPRLVNFNNSENKVQTLAHLLARGGDEEAYLDFLDKALVDLHNPFNMQATIKLTANYVESFANVAQKPWPEILDVIVARKADLEKSWGTNIFDADPTQLNGAEVQKRLSKVPNSIGVLLALEVTASLDYLLEAAVLADFQEIAARVAVASRLPQGIGGLSKDEVTDPLSGQPIIIDPDTRMIRSALPQDQLGAERRPFIGGLVTPGIPY